MRRGDLLVAVNFGDGPCMPTTRDDLLFATGDGSTLGAGSPTLPAHAGAAVSPRGC